MTESQNQELAPLQHSSLNSTAPMHEMAPAPKGFDTILRACHEKLFCSYGVLSQILRSYRMGAFVAPSLVLLLESFFPLA